MVHKLSKFNIYKHLNLFYAYSEKSIFDFFIENMFIIVINCIKHHYLSKEAQLNFFKEDTEKSAKELTNYRNNHNIYLEEIERFIY